ncbi:MAG: hypothetical protein KBS45_06530 [Clostridiales bacterium]|nr:hypothetical protein [Candidatus Coliplasma caballi]
MSAADFGELLVMLLSSSGVLGAGLTAVLGVMLKKARRDAEQKRAERIAVELQRLEGEERLSAVVLALVRAKGENTDELQDALDDYEQYLEKRRELRDKIIGNYTV